MSRAIGCHLPRSRKKSRSYNKRCQELSRQGIQAPIELCDKSPGGFLLRLIKRLKLIFDDIQCLKQTRTRIQLFKALGKFL